MFYIGKLFVIFDSLCSKVVINISGHLRELNYLSTLSNQYHTIYVFEGKAYKLIIINYLFIIFRLVDDV